MYIQKIVCGMVWRFMCAAEGRKFRQNTAPAHHTYERHQHQHHHQHQTIFRYRYMCCVYKHTIYRVAIASHRRKAFRRSITLLYLVAALLAAPVTLLAEYVTSHEFIRNIGWATIQSKCVWSISPDDDCRPHGTNAKNLDQKWLWIKSERSARTIQNTLHQNAKLNISTEEFPIIDICNGSTLLFSFATSS